MEGEGMLSGGGRYVEWREGVLAQYQWDPLMT